MINCTCNELFGGLHWTYRNSKGDSVSVICHEGSYGRDKGLFETMTSWESDVKGHLTFQQVANELATLERKGA